MLSTLQPLIGLFGILGLAYALSTNRKAISPRVVGWGLGLQVLFALIVLKTSIGQRVFEVLGDKMRQLLEFSIVGSGFVFGALGDASVWRRVMTGALGAAVSTVVVKLVDAALVFPATSITLALST